ncbi:DNA repair protein RecN [Devriesea agamarum]|uniref:DNA repair protein RecN n=1 Tax=Devriesea agamarum TaxID=472569 RepID=UPI00071D8AAC|nr:DNA repair protein RecN [Devriesea agamarum]
MLASLRIRGIGVIDDATLEFGPGFTALTGETGAGKTMIVTGLAMLLGARLDGRRMRGGSSVEGRIRLDAAALTPQAEPSSTKAEPSSTPTDPSAAKAEQPTSQAENVEAQGGQSSLNGMALMQWLDELGAQLDDDELLVSRRVTREGRSRAHIGGASAPVATLGTLLNGLVTLHGQADQMRLRDADQQRDLLDAYAGPSALQLRKNHAAAHQRLRALSSERARLEDVMARRADRSAILRSALDRMEKIGAVPGEVADLEREARRLTHAVDLTADAALVADLLVADDGPCIASHVDQAVDRARAAAQMDEAFIDIADRLESMRVEVSDLASTVRRLGEDVEASPGRLDDVNERLHDLSVLVRDLGPLFGGSSDLDSLLAASGDAAIELATLDDADKDLERVNADLDATREELDRIGGELHDVRRDAADRLATAIQDELAMLLMPDAKVTIAVDEGPVREHGRDTVTLLLAPHPGSEAMPVSAAASGGELSRVMLAMEVALAGAAHRDGHQMPVFVFDEIDAGIGGRAGRAVGERLARLAHHAQVIVVTHLPQVAAFADTHLRIVKHSAGEHTASTVEPLSTEERVEELARMLAGDAASDAALTHARELLQEATA